MVIGHKVSIRQRLSRARIYAKEKTPLPVVRRPSSGNVTPYKRMYECIIDAYKQKWQKTLIISIAILTGIVTWIWLSTIDIGWIYKIDTELYAVLNTYGFVSCAILIYRVLGYSTSEEKLMSAAQRFLEREDFEDHILETITKRAEISSSIGPVRSLIPILLIPLIISSLSYFGSLLLHRWLFIGAVILALLLPLLIDTHTTNIDSVIRHAVTEYRCEKQSHQLSRQQDSRRLLKELLQYSVE